MQRAAIILSDLLAPHDLPYADRQQYADAVSHRNVQVIRDLLQAPTTPQNVAHSLRVLHSAIWSNIPEVVDLFFEERFDLRRHDYNLQTPLIWAAQFGRTTVAKRIIDTGSVDIDAADFDGMTALHHAATNERLDTVKLLVECGADARRPNRYGDTALSLARYKKFFKTIGPLEIAGGYPTLRGTPVARYLREILQASD